MTDDGRWARRRGERRGAWAGRAAAGPGALAAALLVAGVWGCGDTGAPGEAGPLAAGGTPFAVEAGTLSARADGGMVVSGAPEATRVGVEILERGGNAVDAAVAAAFTLAVVEPTQSGLGGRTQALLLEADGELYGMDATTEVPGGYDFDEAPRVEHGYPVVGIPGTVAGLLHLLDRSGTLERSVVMAPAIELAESGFVLTEGEADRLDRLVEEPGTGNEAARRYFLSDDGSRYRAGDRFVQPDLARTLRTISAEGADAFYRGGIAERIAADMEANGGFVDTEDLAGYRPRPSIVTRGRYRGLELAGTYLPASGATAIQALQIMDHFTLADADPAAWTAVVGQALLLSFRDRDVAEGEPAPGGPDRPPEEWAELLTSPEWAERRAGDVRLPEGAGVARAGARTPGARRSEGREALPAGRPALPAVTALPGSAARRVPEPAHTTHLSVADTLGGAVAMTQSLGPTMGSRVATDGLGFLYAATLGGYLGDVEPGERAWSSQAPMMAFRDGELRYVMGGAGARRILSALVQTVSRIVDQGHPLEAALALPRFHPTGDTFVLEDGRDEGWPGGVDAALKALGLAPEHRETGTYFARLNVVGLPGDGGALLGVADPRWPWGAVAGLGERQP